MCTVCMINFADFQNVVYTAYCVNLLSDLVEFLVEL